jgi:acetylornithine deacetylase/succinyl-diaminopimelate desuccinylase-like protein
LAALTAAVQKDFSASVADLSKLVRIESVSWDGFDPAAVLQSAEAVKQLVEGLGVFESVIVSRAEIGSTGALGQPAVLATRAARNGKPTILLYAHHDVQPPGNEADWESKPFEPTVRGDRLYGRGAADDKAGVMAHIAAIRALIAVEGPEFEVGLALFIEGEEEFGSRSVTFKLKVSTLAHASHSGMFGGAAPDAMLATIQLLATLHDAHGSVAVPGLRSRESETPAMEEADLRRDAALLDGVSLIGRGPVLSRLWSQPAITITGIDAPTVMNASNTLSPSITVKVSARIAPGQTAANAFDALKTHLTAHAPFGAHLDISDIDLGNPFLVDTTGWAAVEAKAAMAQAWGVAPVETGIGGSIPFIAHLVETFADAQILVTGVEDPDTRAHSPNESLHLGVFRRAILTEALLLAKLNDRA